MVDNLPQLPPGFTLDTPNYGTAPQPAAPQTNAMPPQQGPQQNTPALPAGFTLDQHPASTMPPDLNPGIPEDQKSARNAIQGLNNSVGAGLGLPNSLASLGDYLLGKMGAAPGPGFITRHTYSPDEINQSVAKYGGPVGDEMFMSTDPAVQDSIGKPIPVYHPETFSGTVANHILTGAPLAMIGGGGIPAMIGREVANATGTTAADAAHVAYPDSPGVSLLAGLLGGIGGDAVAGAGQVAGRMASNIGGKLINSKNAQETATAQRLVDGSGMTAPDLSNSIDAGLPNWNIAGNTVQPAPTTATVTMNSGLQGMTYKDMTAAEQRNNPIYRNNANQTNQAQREGVANVTPDISGDIATAGDNLTNQVSALPAGVSAQDAGSNFRSGLQGVYDQRKQDRRDIGTNAFDLLDSSPAQISLRPVMDYATTQAAQQAGPVGQAYQAAANAFRSGTGLTLDTAPFANSVLKGLGDLAESYPPGSAANRAVVDVKNRAEQHIFDQAPEVAAARSAYAQASQPLDVFNPKVTPGPIASSVQTTRFGGYTTPNDAVVSQFLTSKGGPDAIDKLGGVFPDVKSATQSLQDYIASQVQARALNKDGSVNPTALATVLRPYQPILAKSPFSDLNTQFTNLSGAQSAVDGLAARQSLYTTFKDGLGTQARDNGNSPMYSAKAFDDLITKKQPEIVAAYGQPGFTRLTQINKQLQDAAQIAQSKVAGTSGTPQALKTGADNVLSTMLVQAGSEAGGDILGAVLHGAAGALGYGAAGKLLGMGTVSRFKKLNASVDAMTTEALADPNFAKALLTNYNPRQVKPIGQKAMDYVKNRLAGVLAPEASQ